MLPVRAGHRSRACLPSQGHRACVRHVLPERPGFDGGGSGGEEEGGLRTANHPPPPSSQCNAKFPKAYLQNQLTLAVRKYISQYYDTELKCGQYGQGEEGCGLLQATVVSCDATSTNPSQMTRRARGRRFRRARSRSRARCAWTRSAAAVWRRRTTTRSSTPRSPTSSTSLTSSTP